MKKHDCYIETDNKIVIGGYFYHPIKASTKEGFIKDIGYPASVGKMDDRLGAFYEHPCWTVGQQGKGSKPYWWWRLYALKEGGRGRKSNKRFSDKAEAIASLNKALNRKGYQLASPYVWQTEGPAPAQIPNLLDWSDAIIQPNPHLLHDKPINRWEAQARGDRYWVIQEGTHPHTGEPEFILKRMRPRAGLAAEVLNNNGHGLSFATLAEAQDAAVKAETFAMQDPRC